MTTHKHNAIHSITGTIAQVWRAAGDHHDTWSHTMEQLAAVKGKGNWSGPYGWAYLDMM